MTTILINQRPFVSYSEVTIDAAIFKVLVLLIFVCQAKPCFVFPKCWTFCSERGCYAEKEVTLQHLPYGMYRFASPISSFFFYLGFSCFFFGACISLITYCMPSATLNMWHIVQVHIAHLSLITIFAFQLFAFYLFASLDTISRLQHRFTSPIFL